MQAIGYDTPLSCVIVRIGYTDVLVNEWHTKNYERQVAIDWWAEYPCNSLLLCVLCHELQTEACLTSNTLGGLLGGFHELSANHNGEHNMIGTETILYCYTSPAAFRDED